MQKTCKSFLLIVLSLLLCAFLIACGSNIEAAPTKKPSAAPTTTPSADHTHTFRQWQEIRRATCTEDGLEERTCECGEKEQQVVPSTGHIPGEWFIQKEPTATETGSRAIFCLVCNTPLQQEVIPAISSTAGLSYQINEDGVTCTVTGIGTCSDTTLAIGPTIDGYTVTAISAWAFENCTNLYSVVIADSVTNIGDGIFSGCTGLQSVTLPNSITKISNSAFSHCTRLQNIELPNSITIIDYSAFYGCTALNNITIPESVTEISTVAFSGCTSLSTIVIPDSVFYIGEHVFENTAYYNNAANWENGLLYIGNHLVAADSAISGSCVLKAGTRTICSWAFRDCTGMTSITVPEGLVGIGGNAFYGCTSLSSISLPDSICFMAASIFMDTAYYNNAANWENGILYVDNHLVATNENLSGHCTIKPGTRTICDWAFSSREGLTGITIPESVLYIGEYAFYRCTNLSSITIPDGVTRIGDDAFYRCINLTSITISDSITSIGAYAFYRCTALTDIYFTGTKAQWEAIEKFEEWDYNSANYVIHCADGDIEK